MNYRKTLYSHKLATQPLRDLLLMAGRPTTQAENRILAALVRAYNRMRGTFPSKQLGTDLDALYSRAFSVANRELFALALLKAQLNPILPEAEERSLARTTRQSKKGTLRARSEASRAFRRDAAPVLRHCREVLFLALAEATTRINAALKAAKKKR